MDIWIGKGALDIGNGNQGDIPDTKSTSRGSTQCPTITYLEHRCSTFDRATFLCWFHIVIEPFKRVAQWLNRNEGSKTTPSALSVLTLNIKITKIENQSATGEYDALYSDDVFGWATESPVMPGRIKRPRMH